MYFCLFSKLLADFDVDADADDDDDDDATDIGAAAAEEEWCHELLLLLLLLPLLVDGFPVSIRSSRPGAAIFNVFVSLSIFHQFQLQFTKTRRVNKFERTKMMKYLFSLRSEQRRDTRTVKNGVTLAANRLAKWGHDER